MAPLTGTRAGKRHACSHFAPRLVQTFDEIVGQERAVARNADDPLDPALLFGQPVEAGENPRQWPSEIRHRIGDHSQARVGKAFGFAIGINDDACALRGQCRQYAVKDRRAADLNARLVAAAHASREPTCKYETESWRIVSRHAPPLCADAW